MSYFADLLHHADVVRTLDTKDAKVVAGALR